MPTRSTRSKPLILNVNDNEGARYLVTMVLKKAGFDVLEADAGQTALELVTKRQPDLVVLDVRLPDITGFEVCRRIREEPAHEPIKILHTSATYVTTEHKVQSYNEGADGYLVQPFEPEEMTATVRALLRLNEAEVALRRSAEQLREADRRKDEFLAMLGHELRNPLAAITVSLPLIERREPLDDAERRSREVLHRQALHLHRLVDDLLDVARVTQGKIELQLEQTDLSALLRRVVEGIERTRTEPRQQTLRMSLPESPVRVKGDATRLEQVFVNLLDNASKYTEPGGTIEVVVTETHTPEQSSVHVVVRDDGMGINSAALPGIFGLFAQADVPLDRTRGGLGIGLTLVRSLVQLHGGTISARSEGVGRGSEFEVELPLALKPGLERDGDADAMSAQSLTADRPCRVLVVEDSADVREMMRELIGMWGHEVVTSPDGPDGVTQALESRPDIALVDIGLPGIDGYEVARRIRKDARGARLFLVAVTGYGAPEQRERALAAGFDQHIVKPVSVERLQTLVSQVAGRRGAA